MRNRGLWRDYVSTAVVAGLVVSAVLVHRSAPGDLLRQRQGPGPQVPVGQTASGWASGVRPCPGRLRQVDATSYSPPCFTFSGDNGGATAPGVTVDTIRVAYRLTDEPNFFTLLAQIGGVDYDEPPEDLLRTTQGLVDFVNRSFQLYGRRIELVPYRGRGLVVQEIMGAGRDAAANDAVRVAGEVDAFADVTAMTQPYAEALSQRQVVNVGAPFMPREWFAANTPYAWSSLPSCSIGAEAGAEQGVEWFLGKPAERAGGDLARRRRTVGFVVPDNREYQRCGDLGEQILDDHGFEVALRQDYVMDLARSQSQAASVLARLVSARITTVVCACDPVMLTYLAGQAEQQGYQPEWLLLGAGFGDLDLVGQMVARSSGDQWLRAFGSSPLPAPSPPGTGEAYRAYRSGRDDEPSLLVDLLFRQLLVLAIGLQMAGPNLTPETFAAGMYAYPRRSGDAGTWRFSPDNHTGVIDARAIWWDPDARSSFNGQPGTYVDDGTRYVIGALPSEPPPSMSPPTAPGG